jgi:hypothetical protein
VVILGRTRQALACRQGGPWQAGRRSSTRRCGKAYGHFPGGKPRTML